MTRTVLLGLGSAGLLTAMAADGLSTAAMILGRERGGALLRRHGVTGIFQ